ncbi:hypothetical protein AC792_10445 [Arthrobacter sp. RIT-PI-e]|uniref:hypothetical protein n=1 Tax=Arthrobacter sp. RIT-PI-e TaxID=1681197 RepID=UPI000675D098|nr:hypothetical protein [Arthrobacter sp. RIT-PI-e]KNC18707.1 hypothetical protein AC792_10445 [Arthrobacter sp. RIT-PI-e]
MRYVLTINQRDSREVGDLVDDLLRSLRRFPTTVPFQRSVGDEVVGVVDSATTAVDAALQALRPRRWHVGIGVGGVTPPVPEDLLDASGPGLVYARRAVDRARRTGERTPLAVEGPDGAIAADAEAVLRLLGQIVSTRTAAEWAVLDLMTPGARGQQKHVAQELGITAQAVSRAVVRSSWTEEWATRPAAARLLDLAHGPESLPPAGPGS